ncbi:MAG: glycosyltransferase [Candidatus Pacearchaeota archaeon]
MKIAIFHDFFDSIGGGEKVAITLAKGLNADIITCNLNKETIYKLKCEKIRFLNLVNTLNIPPVKQIQASLCYSKCNFSKKYDFFIFSGNWAPFAAKKHKPNLYYCHTPTRVFYDYYKNQMKQLNLYQKPLFYLYAKMHKFWTEKNLKYIEKFIANSANVKKRIKEYFKKDSLIIFPPIDTNKYSYKKSENYWLSVNRLYPHKRIELQIQAFKKLPKEKLIIVGWIAKGEGCEKYLKKILKNLPKNIEIKGKIDETNLLELYSKCKGLITTSKDEDFGMTPIEAMASGKPVIAPNEGGYKETIINGKTGILIDNINEDKIIEAIKRINRELNENPKKYKDNCIKQSKKFDSKIFLKKIKNEIYNRINKDI